MAEGARPLLVLGGSGQVGGALLREAARRGQPAVGTYHAHRLDGLSRWDGDPAALSPLLRDLDPGAVVYATGLTHVDGCESQPAEAERWNAEVPAILAGRGRGRRRFVYVSTEYVFDGRGGPYGEEDPVNPLSAYARSKAHGEAAVRAADPSALIVRTTVVYGPEVQEKNFVAQLRRRLGAGQPMRVPDDQVSSPTYNPDLAAATLALLARGAAGVWHVAGPEPMDRFAFARLAAEAFGLDTALLEPVPTARLGQAAPRPLKAGLRIDKLEAALGAGAMRGPREALAAWAAAEGAGRR